MKNIDERTGLTGRSIVGVDIGGVIISRSNDNADTSFFGTNYLRTPAVDDAFEAISRLSRAGFEVHLVSKCGANTERKTREWLAHHNFYGITSVCETDVHFCRERKDKALICRDLGVTHFVDDRLEVLSYLDTVKFKYLFSPVESEVQKHARYLSSVTRVETWSGLATMVLERDAVVVR